MDASASWPTEPDALGQVPSFEEIAALHPELAPIAELVKGVAERLRREGASTIAYQQVVDTPLGQVTVPCLAETEDGAVAIYGHKGAFGTDDLRDLMTWTQRIRGRWLDTIEIDLATDAPESGIALRAREVVLNAPASILGVLAVRRFTSDAPENAVVFAGACEAILGFEPGLDRKGLTRLDESFELFGPIGRDFVFRDVLIGLFGAFLGEVLVAAGVARWGPPAPGKPDWWKTLDCDLDATPVRSGRLDPMQQVSVMLADGQAGLIALLDLLRVDPAASGTKAPAIPAPPAAAPEPLTPSAPGELRPNAAARIYGVLAHLAECDGEVADEERQVLLVYRERLGIERAAAERLEADAASGKVRIGKDPEERRVLSSALLEIIMADGKVDEQERLKLARIVKAVGFKKDELGPLLRFVLKPQ